MKTPNTNFAFLLVPGFSLVTLSCAIDVLRAANMETGEDIFRWVLIGDKDDAIASSSGIEMPYGALDQARDFDAIAVCGGERSHVYQNTSVTNWLKEIARRGKLIGSLSDGAYVVSKAGLFKNARSTIHWKCQAAYREMFPDQDVKTSIMEVDGKRFSCAGGTASLDLMLKFVATSVGTETVGRIANNYFHDVIRDDDQVQRMTGAFRFALRSKIMSDALLIMEENLETPVSVERIAQQLSISHRHLDRLFHRYLNLSPSHHYRDLRLTRASGLLKQTELSVGEIALGCGFQSASHLSKFFRRKFTQTPLAYRLGK